MKFRPRYFLFAIGTVATIMSLLTYGKWEYLTWKHRVEIKTIFIPLIQSTNLLLEPKFMKILEYSSSGYTTKVFMVENNGQDLILDFKKYKDKKWSLEHWDYCTTANGTPSCFFPWYSSREFSDFWQGNYLPLLGK